MLAALADDDNDAYAYEILWQTQALATRTIAARQQIPREDAAGHVATELQRVRNRLASQIRISYPDHPYEMPLSYCSDTLRELTAEKERLERKLAGVYRSSYFVCSPSSPVS